MTRVRARGEDVRRYILDQVQKHPTDIAKKTAEHFGVTRQAVSKHLRRLVAEQALVESGETRNRSYRLALLSRWTNKYRIAPDLAEDVIWRNDVKPVLGRLPDNVMGIWQFGFTEMFNNAIDHSEGARIVIDIEKTAAVTKMMIRDDGVGIFKKIQTGLHLLDERHAILELAKGKLTTDPKRHTGEGVFFTSRIFDRFAVLSGGVHFSHQFGKEEDWIQEIAEPRKGTAVWLELNNHTARTAKKIFDQFSSGDVYGFNKTVVPVELARYGDDQLISRSQAKRLLTRIERFKTVMFDFHGVDNIGQAFADEIFRVFAQEHPAIELVPIKASTAVKRMIERVKSGA
jgi:anti-sigma regulatory factor (Ser/Thr protein kinase)